MPSVILLVQNRIYREGLCQILSARKEFSSVHSCCDIGSLRSLAATASAPVVLFDMSVPPSTSRCGALTEVRRVVRDRPVIALSLQGSDDEVLCALESGAAAFVTQNDSIEDLVRSIHAAADGQFRCPPRIARLMQERLANLSDERARSERLERLSQRECCILGLLGNRLSNKQIARQLGLEVSTIKNHVHNIIVKLDVKNRTEAAALTHPADPETA